MRSKTNHLLDCLKGFGCIAVVFIHVHFPGFMGDIVWRLSQFAVPIFFMTSGYYAFSNNKEWLNTTLKRRGKRILWLSTWTTLLYFVITKGYAIITNKVLFEGDLITFLSHKAIRFLLLQDVDFSGGHHLWFLWALFWVYIILLIINHLNLWEFIRKLMPLLIIINISISVIKTYYGWSWHLSGNVTSAFFWVIMGNYIAAHKDKLHVFSNKVLLFSSVIGATVSLTTFLKLTYDFSQIGIILFATSLFLLAIKKPDTSLGNKIEVLGNKYSLDVYVFHMLVAMIITKILKVTGFDMLLIGMWLKPILVVIGAFLVSYFKANISKHITA